MTLEHLLIETAAAHTWINYSRLCTETHKGKSAATCASQMQATTHKHAVHASRWGSPRVRKQICQKPAAGQQPVATAERKQPEELPLKISIHSISIDLQSGSLDILKPLSAVIHTLDKSPVQHKATHKDTPIRLTPTTTFTSLGCFWIDCGLEWISSVTSYQFNLIIYLLSVIISLFIVRSFKAINR